jgi:hypothetical protein
VVQIGSASVGCPGTPIASIRPVHNLPTTPPAARWRSKAWAVAGAGVAAVCLGLAALASRYWPKPEPSVLPTTALRQTGLQEAEREESNAGPHARAAQALEPREPAAGPSAPLPHFAEQRAYSSRSEIQRVAGRDRLDAGSSDSPANVDAAALVSQLRMEAPQTAPEPEENAAEPIPPGETCGLATCPAGYGCCNPSCGVCVAPGHNCDPTPCQSRIQYPASDMCGRSTCSVGEVCCNPSCGICVAPGESCDQNVCENAIQYPFSAICGRVTCSVGQECCNPSCGICVSPGETCSQQWCD